MDYPDSPMDGVHNFVIVSLTMFGPSTASRSLVTSRSRSMPAPTPRLHLLTFNAGRIPLLQDSITPLAPSRGRGDPFTSSPTITNPIAAPSVIVPFSSRENSSSSASPTTPPDVFSPSPLSNYAEDIRGGVLHFEYPTSFNVGDNSTRSRRVEKTNSSQSSVVQEDRFPGPSAAPRTQSRGILDLRGSIGTIIAGTAPTINTPKGKG